MSAGRYDLLLAGGTVVDGRRERRADVAVRDGRIAAVGDLDGATADEVVDVTGRAVLPGLVDEHVHPTYLDDVSRVGEVALRGGVTTLMHFAYAGPGESLVAAFEAMRADGEARSPVDFVVHPTMFDAPAQIAELPAVLAAGARSVKVFLAYAALGWMTDDAHLCATMEILARDGGLLLVHAENGPAIDVLERRADRSPGADAVGAFLATRPACLEAEAVTRVTTLAGLFGCDLLVVHVTSADALAAVRVARERNPRFVAETCPQYLTLSSAAMHERGALAKIGPPLREDEDVAALWDGVADGTIRTIGSDHVPKKTPRNADDDLWDAGFGAPSLETMLLLLHDEGVATGRIDLPALVRLTSEHPARLFGLHPRKGAVVEGADADLVVLDPDGETVIAADTLHCAAGYSLHEGRRCRGAIRLVVRAGAVAVRDGVLAEDLPRGRWLPVGPFDTVLA